MCTTQALQKQPFCNFLKLKPRSSPAPRQGPKGAPQDPTRYWLRAKELAARNADTLTPSLRADDNLCAPTPSSKFLRTPLQKLSIM